MHMADAGRSILLTAGTALAAAAITVAQHPNTTESTQAEEGSTSRQVQVTVPLSQAINDVAVWTAPPPDGRLLVIGRDTRSAAQRQAGAPSTSSLAPGTFEEGEVTIDGVVMPLPHAEARFSWGLSQEDMRRLEEQGEYVRAYGIAR
jgi:hypothetical protein